jgi:hypothetical protein
MLNYSRFFPLGSKQTEIFGNGTQKMVQVGLAGRDDRGLSGFDQTPLSGRLEPVEDSDCLLILMVGGGCKGKNQTKRTHAENF